MDRGVYGYVYEGYEGYLEIHRSVGSVHHSAPPAMLITHLKNNEN